MVSLSSRNADTLRWALTQGVLSAEERELVVVFELKT